MKNSENYLGIDGAVDLLRSLLAEVEGVEYTGARPPRPEEVPGADLVVEASAGRRRIVLLVGVRSSGEPRMIQRFAGEVRSGGEVREGHPVMVAPFVSSRGRDLCRLLGLGFIDAAGNAHLNVPGLLVERIGRKNPRRERRELRALFSKKASWVSRRLFAEPSREWTMAELSRESGVSIGHVKKVVDRLEAEALVEKEWGSIRLSDPASLLDMWREAYEPKGWVGYHSPLREQGDLLERLRALREDGWALTLGAGATLVAPFVRSSDVHIYVVVDMDALKEALDLTPVEFGGNVHLSKPDDEGVMVGSREVEGVTVVSDLQLYLDLYGWPARGQEQAEHLRETVIGV
jgi:hypothetical protein